MAILVLIGGVILLGTVIFLFGEDLFGSDRASIDEYNQTVLESCDLPPDSTLLRTNIKHVTLADGQRLRAMTYIWASPLPAQDVAAFYEAPGPGVWTRVSEERACRFSQRPTLLLLERWTEGSGPIEAATQTAGPDDPMSAEFWAGPTTEVITDIAEIPETTESFFLLEVGQREVDGSFSEQPRAPEFARPMLLGSGS